ncbi:polyhydroxyalkanoate synthase [Bacillus sp. OV322]|uniref:alpha/beta fold hydrolase n=1 Tax=Bacillus sp. OV322 TaxID=1882764 RepID=UPI0008E06B8D|nr:alpha/beta fold hydrolase [Bacillus sp. OV322]SFC70488.1 polyhydroxyalkanoate synthase [Bacillus sp. OV322]
MDHINKPQEDSKLKHFFELLKEPMPDMGMTDRMAIWKKNKATLWYYKPEEKKYKVPIFLIYSLVNEPILLDLAPGYSLIEAFVKQGFEVYLLDFGIPGYEDSDLGLDQYITDYIGKGVQRALKHSHAKDISVMGFCLGGTLAAIYASVAEEPVKNLILSAAPINFGKVQVFDQWMEALLELEDTAGFEELIDVFKVMPANSIQAGMRLITSPVYFAHYLSLLEKADDKEYVKKWRRFNHWANSYVPMTGAFVKQILNELVKENTLIEGGLLISGQNAELESISANILVVANENDRLVPHDMILPVMEKLTTPDKTYHLLKSGHSSLNWGGELPGYLREWLLERSDAI